MRRRAAIALLVPCAAFTCGPGPAPLPPADVCATPAAPATPFTLEIGGTGDTFQAWEDGATTRTILGGQGSDMIAVRARLVGADLPSCIRLTVRVMIRDVEAGLRSGVVATYADGAGRSTKPLYVELYDSGPGDRATIAATVGDVTTKRVVVLDP